VLSFLSGFKGYLQTRIATSGQISPQTAQPVHPPLSSQTTKKYPCRLISSPIRINSFGQEIVQSPQPLQRSRSISILAMTCNHQIRMSKSEARNKFKIRITKCSKPFWSFEFRTFGFVSNFDIRILNFHMAFTSLKCFISFSE
jgi:hypothetical protein